MKWINWIFLIILLIVFLWIDVSGLLSSHDQKVNAELELVIFWEYRLPRGITALIVGGGLAICGLVMQTLFRNPLAGPDILGLSAGANLAVAVFYMGTSFVVYHAGSVALAAFVGAALVSILVLSISLVVRHSTILLLLGLMISSLVYALVSFLQYVSSANNLKAYTVWTMGSIAEVDKYELWILLGTIFTITVIIFYFHKHMDVMRLGDLHAQTTGLNIRTFRLLLLFCIAMIAGVITAFCGPISFVSIAVPHIAEIVSVNKSHRVLIPSNFLIGALIVIFCDVLANIPIYNEYVPINVLTSIIGAPVVIYLLINGLKRNFAV